MKFYEGAISYWDLEDLPIPRVLSLNDEASRIIEQMKKEGAKK